MFLKLSKIIESDQPRHVHYVHMYSFIHDDKILIPNGASTRFKGIWNSFLIKQHYEIVSYIWISTIFYYLPLHFYRKNNINGNYYENFVNIRWKRYYILIFISVFFPNYKSFCENMDVNVWFFNPCSYVLIFCLKNKI